MGVESYFDIAAVISIIVLIIALFIRKLTRGRTNMLILTILVLLLLCGSLDIIDSCYGPFIDINTFSTKIRKELDYLCFIFRNLVQPIFIMYICSLLGVWHKVCQNMKHHLLVTVPYLIDVGVLVSNHFNKKVFYFNDYFEYCRGPLMSVLYIVALYYVLLGLFVVIKNRRLARPGKIALLIAFLPINAGAVFVQLIIPSYRIDLFATALFALAIIVGVQRPEEMMDYVVGTSSFNAFLVDAKRSYAAETPICLLLIRFVNYPILRKTIGLAQSGNMLRKISNKIYRMCKIMSVYADVYYLDNGTFAVTCPVQRYEQILDAGRIMAAYMQEPFAVEHLEIMLDSRICLLKCPEDISSLDSLLNFVNTFHNKLPEERRVITFAQLMSTSKDFRIRHDIEAIINRGIQNHKFKMYYQPIYSIDEKRFVSAEALIRLEDEYYGFVSPALFIPAAEENGAIHQIGDFVLEDVCRFISECNFEALGLEYIEVNLSVAQCIETNLYEKLLGYMEKYKVRPDQINLEITETSVDYDPITTDNNIRRLSGAGLSFSLDDYGTGYSNIKRVVTLPLDIVKLDKCLVDEMDSNTMWIVIKNTVSMLKKMKKKILVEGVEDKRALDKFVDIGCNYIQGYYFSKPLPEGDFIDFIRKENLIKRN